MTPRRHFGTGSFPFDAQVHEALPPRPESVEMGQLLLLRVDPRDPAVDTEK